MYEPVASAKTPLCFGNFFSPKQIFFLSPEHDSSILEMRVEGMLYPSVLENVLQRKVLLFLAGDELKQNFDSGNCYHRVSCLEVIRWQYFSMICVFKLSSEDGSYVSHQVPEGF